MDTQQEKQPDQPPADPARRRLTQAGLAAPVVLATLASRNALAATPYNCTVSGKLSGNTSSHGQPVSCSSLGVSPGCWKSQHVCGSAPLYSNNRWPSPYTPTTPFTTAFTSYPSGFNSKTLLQGLQAQGGGNIAFARAAIASLLNSLAFAPDYPLTPSQVQALFNATCNGGTITLSTVFPGITGTTAWGMDDVKNYFESLYGTSDQCPAGMP
ncbi:MAG: hypothetical protein ACYC0P_13785 [Thiobacillus sp.]